MKLALVVTTCITLAALATPLGHAARCDRACHDRQIVAFFSKHGKLARTPAGKLALLEVRVRRLDAQVRALSSARSTPEGAIRFVFGGYADQALAVARCESGYSVNATNGQYLGLFQMGDYARSAYGHGPDALTQARSAYAYFAASGYDWSPWSCRPEL